MHVVCYDEQGRHLMWDPVVDWIVDVGDGCMRVYYIVCLTFFKF